ncbi:hypothetical protein AMTRI_Chr08g168750 [Amborella trichopoda]|uniref:Reticulon-like protein n=1 Tax=Amborella trichopoda TaxID=13333 RepID=W1P368_AMBTC|nr:reticulon-like protein B5 [Amborella trichopoda]ERN04292.1 hypothetical protein AMTR_s00077p00178230 [Amborella trichopoda]|eukprot:XP_006842617.1 reticulon-like protein B5 [Amborella trichopoda]
MPEGTDESGSHAESIMEKIKEKIHGEDDSSSSSSSSDSETEKPSLSAAKAKVNRLFGRQKPVHSVLGGGKPADVLLWRNKQISAGVLVGVTVIWLLFEWLGYHLLTLICHSLVLSLSLLFLWSNASALINKSPPKFPEINLSEDVFVSIAVSLTYELNCVFATLRDVASGRDLKKFLLVTAGLWVLSVVGSWCNFLTLFYIVFVILHTVPVLYEKHEDKVDFFAERALGEAKKQYRVVDAKFLQKIPKGPFKDKKLH